MAHDDVVREVERTIDDAVMRNGAAPNRDLVYRGSTIDRLNADEFQDNSIEGEGIDVWHMTMPEEAMDDVKLATELPDGLPGTLDRHEIVPVSGGLSDNLGTGVFFSQQREQLPLLLYLDRDRIEGEIHRVQYEYEWFNEHPGALAHVDTFGSGEVFANGNLVGLASQKPNEPPTIDVWTRNIRGRASSLTFEKEAETIAMAPEIDLDASVVTTASWYIEAGPVVPSINSVLAAQEGFARRRFEAREEGVENIEFWDEEEMAVALHDLVRDEMRFIPEEYWTIVMTRQMGKEDMMLPPEWFKFAYDGDEIVRSMDALPPELVGQQQRVTA